MRIPKEPVDKFVFYPSWYKSFKVEVNPKEQAERDFERVDMTYPEGTRAAKLANKLSCAPLPDITPLPDIAPPMAPVWTPKWNSGNKPLVPGVYVVRPHHHTDGVSREYYSRWTGIHWARTSNDYEVAVVTSGPSLYQDRVWRSGRIQK